MNSKTNRGFISVIIVLLVLVGFGAFYFLGTLKPKSDISTPTSKPTESGSLITPTSKSSTPDPTIKDWKTFKSEDFRNKDSIYNAYQVKYPPNCHPKKDYAIKVFECEFSEGNATIIFNAGGHGAGDGGMGVIMDNVSKKYSSGEGKLTEVEIVSKKEITGTFWFNKTDLAEYYSIWGLEFYGVSKDNLEEFNIILDKILNSVEFLE